MPESPCLGEALRETRAALAQASDSPQADALWLWQHALGKPRSWLLAHPEYGLSAAQLRHGRHLVRARSAGHSVAHLCGKAYFHDLELRLRTSVLAPRPETETLLHAALRDLPPHARILEWGTGCGALALALALARPDCTVVAYDFRRTAVRLARANALRHRARNLHFAFADWRKRWRDGRYHLIIANPPYVELHDPHLRGPGVRCEPRAALVATEHGTAALRSLANRAWAHRAPGARLLLEHGYDQGTRVRRLVARAGWGRPRTLADGAGHPRACLASV